MDKKRLIQLGMPFVLTTLASSEVLADENPLRVGSALRFNHVYKDWDNAWQDRGELAFDTARINLDWDDDVLIGSMEYRYYRDKQANGHDYQMLHDGWVGVRVDDKQQLQTGVNKVPFRILSYASHN